MSGEGKEKLGDPSCTFPQHEHLKLNIAAIQANVEVRGASYIAA